MCGVLGMRGCEGGVGVGECELERGRRRTFYMWSDRI